MDLIQPCPPTPEVVICGKRTHPASMIISGLVVAAVAWDVYSGGGNGSYFLLALVGMVFLMNVDLYFRPPQITLRQGLFSLRFGLQRVFCPVSDVADISMEGNHLRLVFHTLDRLEPGKLRSALRQNYAKCGIHLEQPAGIYTLPQANEIRRALGLPEQAADVSGSQLNEFHQAAPLAP